MTTIKEMDIFMEQTGTDLKMLYKNNVPVTQNRKQCEKLYADQANYYNHYIQQKQLQLGGTTRARLIKKLKAISDKKENVKAVKQ